ncbi:MAG TPA: cytochrome c [Candidatus Eisenbacteria bacterium]|nr:cytochrome c [Candidatus Eisenbacteria bacterium]
MRSETLLPWPILTDTRILILLFLISVPARAQETGEGLFKAKCGMCHGADASGKTVMGQKLKVPDLHSADVQKKADAELGQLITKGKEKMPAYEGKLSKEQIEKLVAFIREVGKKH